MTSSATSGLSDPFEESLRGEELKAVKGKDKSVLSSALMMTLWQNKLIFRIN